MVSPPASLEVHPFFDPHVFETAIRKNVGEKNLVTAMSECEAEKGSDARRFNPQRYERKDV